MITCTSGNILHANTQALVNTVNTVGIMGKGLALQFKKMFPFNFREYERACKENRVILGKMFIVQDSFMGSTKFIINFPTKNNWKNKSRLQDIISGLQDMVIQLKALDISSVAIPPLGCGLGGLAWSDVKTEIEKIFSLYPEIDVQIYEPLKTANPAPVQFSKRHLTEIKAAVLTSFMRYMELAVSTDITFVETHKLCYFAQLFGIDLKLKFAPYRYGPYAQNLSYLLRDMENIWISGYGDGTKRAFDTFCLLPALKDVLHDITSSIKAVQDKLFQFIAGYETPLGLELLATVHWLAAQNNIPLQPDPMLRAIAGWCDNRNGWGHRKAKYFKPPFVENAIERIKTL